MLHQIHFPLLKNIIRPSNLSCCYQILYKIICSQNWKIFDSFCQCLYAPKHCYFSFHFDANSAKKTHVQSTRSIIFIVNLLWISWLLSWQNLVHYKAFNLLITRIKQTFTGGPSIGNVRKTVVQSSLCRDLWTELLHSFSKEPETFARHCSLCIMPSNLDSSARIKIISQLGASSPLHIMFLSESKKL